jgi:hypothetical protein
MSHIFEIASQVLDLVAWDSLLPVLSRRSPFNECLLGALGGQFGEMGVAETVPFQSICIGARDGREVAAGPGRCQLGLSMTDRERKERND